MDELYRKLLAQLEEGQDTVLAFITEGDGSIPRTTGAYMLVGREGRIFGTIGGGKPGISGGSACAGAGAGEGKVNTENTISEPERGRGLAWSAAAE